MKSVTKKKIIGMIVLLSIVMACSIPGQELFVKPTITSTPNQTMTSLFAPPINIATSTIAAIQLPSFTPSLSPTAIQTYTQTVTASTTPTTTATHTTTATNTPTFVTSSSTLVPPSGCYRTGERFEAVKFSPTIDGVWDEWNSSQYPANHVVYGSENWVSNQDLGASFRIAWDSTNLYLAAKVGDDHYVQNASGQEIYKGDSLEILLDTDLCSDYYSNTLNSDDYQLGISPGRSDINGPKEAFLWFPKGFAGSRPSVLIASVSQNGIYRVEAAVPWNIFGVSPRTGDVLGFAFSVSDNDDSIANIQQTMVSSVTTRRLTNPMTWGNLTLK